MEIQTMLAQVRQFSLESSGKSADLINSPGELYAKLKSEYGLNFILNSCTDKQACFFGSSPLLRELDSLQSETLVLVWMDCLNDYLGSKKGLTEIQIDVLSKIISREFSFLKVTEIMLCINDLITVMRKKFYEVTSPVDITNILHEWVDNIRSVAICKHEESEHLVHVKEVLSTPGISWEEVCKIKGIHDKQSPIVQLMSCGKFTTKRSIEEEKKATLRLARSLKNNTLEFDDVALKNAETAFLHSHGITVEQYLSDNS